MWFSTYDAYLVGTTSLKHVLQLEYRVLLDSQHISVSLSNISLSNIKGIEDPVVRQTF